MSVARKKWTVQYTGDTPGCVWSCHHSNVYDATAGDFAMTLREEMTVKIQAEAGVKCNPIWDAFLVPYCAKECDKSCPLLDGKYCTKTDENHRVCEVAIRAMSTTLLHLWGLDR